MEADEIYKRLWEAYYNPKKSLTVGAALTELRWQVNQILHPLDDGGNSGDSNEQ